MSHSNFDICIRGAGIVGKTLALQLAQATLRVALVQPDQIEKKNDARDIRAYALNHASRNLLAKLRCWPDADSTAVQSMYIAGDAGGRLHFDVSSPQDNETALAWLVDVASLENRLTTAVQFQPNIEILQEPVQTALTVICEGYASQTRAALNLATKSNIYPQTAIAARLRASQSHAGHAYQWFSDKHILALLPLGGISGDEFALVWSTAHASAQFLCESSEEDFIKKLAHIVARAPQGTMDADSRFELTTKRASWPLHLSQALHWCGSLSNQVADSSLPFQSWLLAGDAAHTVHPLAGSGLNLGLGDVIALSDIITHKPDWRSVGDMRLLRQYERNRKAALLPYSLATDTLQWLFWQDHFFLKAMRNKGMSGFSQIYFLKDKLIQQSKST